MKATGTAVIGARNVDIPVTDWSGYRGTVERIAHVRRVFDDARIDANGCASLLELTTADAVTRRAARLMGRRFPLVDVEAGLTRWDEMYRGRS